MDKPGFIVPPPGLIPSQIEEKTVPAVKIVPAALPAFVPTPIGAPRPGRPVPSQSVPSQSVPSAPVLPQGATQLPTSWRLRLADGQSIEATGSLVLGRDPAQVDVRPHATRVPVNDDAKSVSKTHAIIDVEGSQLFVTDLHSTNGVIVTDPDGTQTDLPPGGRAVLNAGSRVLLGEFVIDVLHE